MNNENLINRYRKSFIFTILTLSIAANSGFAQVVPDLPAFGMALPELDPLIVKLSLGEKTISQN